LSLVKLPDEGRPISNELGGVGRSTSIPPRLWSWGGGLEERGVVVWWRVVMCQPFTARGRSYVDMCGRCVDGVGSGVGSNSTVVVLVDAGIPRF
jgi:hypothetical protein